jgi:neutral ceramidase
MAKLKAGVGIRDISPEKGIRLCGYPRFDRPNKGIHDPLYASCLFLDDCRTKIVTINCDLVFFEKPFVKKVREEISKAIGIPGSNIMLSASHTHSGPFTRTQPSGIEKSVGWYIYSYPEYLDWLVKKLTDCVSEAYNNADFAKIGFGKGVAGREKGIGGNRNDKNGLADPAVDVIGVQNIKGKWMAIWVKYSLHPTFLHEDTLLVSADYPGYIREYMAKNNPDAVMLFAQGATGDQSSRFFRKGQTFEEAKRFGYAIGSEAEKVLDSMSMSDSVILGSESKEVMPELKDIPSLFEAEAEVERYDKELEKLKKSGASYTEIQTCHLDKLGAEFNLMYANFEKEKGNYPLAGIELPFEIQAIRIGDCCIVGIPSEIYVKFTLEIEKNSPCGNTFVLTVTNGIGIGYIVTWEAAEKGIFEAGVGLTKLGTEDKVVKTSLEVIDDLYKKG